MVSLELVTDRDMKEPARWESQEVYLRGAEQGVLFGESRYAGIDDLLKVKAPLDIDHELLAEALDVLDDALGDIENNR
jgi:4-aminobutyrate aminotransferase-like enzyme